MAIIHCGFTPHQNKSVNQKTDFISGIILRMIPQRNHSLNRCTSLSETANQ